MTPNHHQNCIATHGFLGTVRLGTICATAIDWGCRGLSDLHPCQLDFIIANAMQTMDSGCHWLGICGQCFKICTLILQPCYIPQYFKNFAPNPIWWSGKLKREPLLLTTTTQPYISRLCGIREKQLGLQIYNFLCTNRPRRNGKIKFVLCISSNTHFYLWSLDRISSGRGVHSNWKWVQTCLAFADDHCLTWIRYTTNKRYGLFGKLYGNTGISHYDLLEMDWHQTQPSILTLMHFSRVLWWTKNVTSISTIKDTR